VDTLAIIPAAANAQAFPGLYLATVSGRPLIAHSIETALESGKISRVFVATNLSKVADVGRTFEAEVLHIPEDLQANQHSGAVVDYMLYTLKTQAGYQPELVMILSPDAPLRPSGVIEQCIDHLLQSNADSLLTVCESMAQYWERVSRDVSRIDLQRTAYRENGVIYLTRRRAFQGSSRVLSGHVEMVVMPESGSLQIRTPHDLWLIEQKMRYNEDGDRIRPIELKKDLKNVQLVVLGVDGVLTDGGVFFDEMGDAMRRFNFRDRSAIKQLRDAGIHVALINTADAPNIDAWASQLEIEDVIMGRQQIGKLEEVMELAEKYGLSADEVAFVANDTSDMDALNYVGVPVATADASTSVRNLCRIVLKTKGGGGAAGEFAELLLGARSDRYYNI